MKPKDFLSQPATHYSDWFGKGNTHQDYRDIVKDEGEPQEVYQDHCMICLLYTDKIIVVGYDGDEYFHTFTFLRQ